MTPGKPGPSTEHAPQPDKHGGGGNPLAGIIAIVLFVIWIWALQDCLRRGPGGFPSGSKYDKPVWIFVIVFTLFIGALLYLFCLFGQPREGKTA
ncbi:MAG: DUF2516 family protein [bacterium]|nr:DUF2516 family protein [bacterium]